MNVIDALQKKRNLRRLVPSHVGSNGDGWLSWQYVLTKLTEGGLPEVDVTAYDWEVQSSAGDRLQTHIRQIEMETGKTPNVLDVPEEDFNEIEQDCWRRGVKDKDRGYYQQLVVYMGLKGETRIVKARK